MSLCDLSVSPLPVKFPPLPIPRYNIYTSRDVQFDGSGSVSLVVVLSISFAFRAYLEILLLHLFIVASRARPRAQFLQTTSMKLESRVVETWTTWIFRTFLGSWLGIGF